MAKNTFDTLLAPEASEERLWELFHDNSKVSLHDAAPPHAEVLRRMDNMLEAFAFDSYPATPLPTDLPALDMSVKDAIVGRRSGRAMQPKTLRLDELAALLHLACGVTADGSEADLPRDLRAAPSGGALYPLDVFFHTTLVDGLPYGLYHYDPTKNQVRHLRAEDCSRTISKALVQPKLPYETSLMVFLVASFERATFKYGERGYRFALLEAGHIAQNINLTAHAMGLAALNIGGYLDRGMDRFLSLDGVSHSTIYCIAVGEPSSGREPFERDA